MSVACPKCGAEADDVGSKFVCGECYWVFDKGGSIGTAPQKAAINVPTPQRPTMAPGAPLPTLQPSTPAPAAAPTTAPSACPKCAGNLVNISGKFVCEKCFHTVDTPDVASQAPRAPGVQAPSAPASAGPAAVAPAQVPQAPSPLASAPTPNPTASQIPAPPPPQAAATTATVCPKCAGNLVEIGGKFVCEKCFHTVDTPDSAPAAKAPVPSARPSAPAPLVMAAAAPVAAAASSSPSTGMVCPKCSANLMDISGKLVCEQCYHVVDSPSSAPAAKSALPFAKPAVTAFTPPTVCPKCSGALMDVGGKFVCDACYHVVDTPGSSPIPINSFTPRPTEKTEEGELSPQMIGGIALILLLVLMIIVLAIRH